MTRSVIILAGFIASAASAQQTTGPVGRTLPLHTPTPPPLPISRFKPTNSRLQRPRGVVFVPSYLYNTSPYDPYAAYYSNVPETNVSVANYNYYGGNDGMVSLPTGLQWFAGGYAAGRLWNPQPEDSAPAPAPAADTRVPLVAPAAVTADVHSLDAIIASFYDVLSGPSIKGRDWNRFRSLFADGAHLITTLSAPGLPASPLVMTAEDYATNAGPIVQRGLFEKEINRTVEQFGRMAQVFSTFESRYHDTDAKPFQRAVNSIQLMNDGTRWWIVSMYWDAERPDNPIPAKYLPPVKP